MSVPHQDTPQAASPQRAPSQINLRVTPDALALIDHAAQLSNKSRTDFMLETAMREAETVLLDQGLFKLDADAFARFSERLDEPARVRPKLRALLRSKSPWER